MTKKNKVPDNALAGLAELFGGMLTLTVVLLTVMAALTVTFLGTLIFVAYHFITA